jgi:RNA ligase (TIGR02306 family)
MPDDRCCEEIFDIDLSEALGIQKWEKPISAQLSGMVKGNFPTLFRKTDEERIQNCKKLFQQAYDNDWLFEVSIKLDGSSASFGNLITEEGIDVHVCSRNMSLKLDQEGNSFVDVAKSLNLIEKLSALTDRQIQFSGELMGPGIQGNREKLAQHEVFIFNVFDVDKQEYISVKERKELVEQFGLKQVPILHESITLRELGLDTIEKVLAFAEGPSLNAKLREGLVFKAIDGSCSFKAIANSYLLKYSDE